MCARLHAVMWLIKEPLSVGLIEASAFEGAKGCFHGAATGLGHFHVDVFTHQRNVSVEIHRPPTHGLDIFPGHRTKVGASRSAINHVLNCGTYRIHIGDGHSKEDTSHARFLGGLITCLQMVLICRSIGLLTQIVGKASIRSFEGWDLLLLSTVNCGIIFNMNRLLISPDAHLDEV